VHPTSMITSAITEAATFDIGCFVHLEVTSTGCRIIRPGGRRSSAITEHPARFHSTLAEGHPAAMVCSMTRMCCRRRAGVLRAIFSSLARPVG